MDTKEIQYEIQRRAYWDISDMAEEDRRTGYREGWPYINQVRPIVIWEPNGHLTVIHPRKNDKPLVVKMPG
jgi:hypothetical protein